MIESGFLINIHTNLLRVVTPCIHDPVLAAGRVSAVLEPHTGHIFGLRSKSSLSFSKGKEQRKISFAGLA